MALFGLQKTSFEIAPALFVIFVTVATCHSQISNPHYLILDMTSDFRHCFIRCYQHEGCGSFKFSPQTTECLGYLTGYEDDVPNQSGFQQYRLCRSRGCPAHEQFVRLRGSGMCVRVSGDARDWESARDSCRRHHSDLVVIDTREKSTSLQAHILTRGPFAKYEDYMWVGMRRYGGSRKYKWVRGGSTWAAWGRGDPSFGAEKCVQLLPWGVSDVRCQTKKRFICEIHINA